MHNARIVRVVDYDACAGADGDPIEGLGPGGVELFVAYFALGQYGVFQSGIAPIRVAAMSEARERNVVRQATFQPVRYHR